MTQNRIITLVLLGFMAATVWLSWRLNIWQDEVYTLDTTGAGPWRAAQRAMAFELQPPLYFTALSVWREVSTSLVWSRVFSAVAVAGAIALWVDVARHLVPDVPSWAVAALAVTSYPLLWAASEARCYGLVVLLTALIVWTWQRGYLAETPSRAARIGLVLAGIAGLYTQYYVGFVLVACAAGLVAAGRWTALTRYLGSMALVGVALLPLLTVVRRQVEGHAAVSPVGQHASVSTAARETYWRLQDYVLPIGDAVHALPRGMAIRDWVTRASLALAAAALLIYRQRVPRELLGLVLGLIAAFVALRMIVGPDFFVSRYTLALLLPAQLGALALLALPRNRNFLVLGSAALVAAGTAVSVELFAPLAKQGDWQRVADYVQTTDDASPVLVFANVGEAPLERYYTGTGPIVPLPAALDVQTYDPAASALESIEGTRQRITEATSPRSRYWVVVAHAGAFQGVDKHPEMLEAALAADEQVLKRRDFFGATVRLFERKDTPEPSGRT